MPALRSSGTIVVAVALVGALSAASGWAQLFIYPQRGQSAQQQQQDRFECHQWAVQQTGFDPTMAVAPPPTAAPGRTTGALGGAATGAAIGAVGGAIGGNAGRGAAIGAGAGALFGTMRRNSQIRDAEAQQMGQAQQQNQQRDAYNRALAACLSGRGYTVQ
jgi:hypothetical protein